MKISYLYCLVLCLVLCLGMWVGCEDPNPSTTNPPVVNEPPKTVTDSSKLAETPNATPAAPIVARETQAAPTAHNCVVKAKHYDKNVFWAQDMQRLIAIVADKSTFDADLGESHRILEIYNTADCSVIDRITLPVNRSPDFPYYLASNTYEANNKIIAIQGYNNPYFYDLESNKLSKALEPEFISETEAVDAQSGMIKGLTIWGHYLMGHSIDYGPFAIDIAKKTNPQPVKAAAKYPIPKTAEFRSLFLLEEANGRYNAILPITDIDAGGNLFELKRLLPQGINTDAKLPKNIRNNRYLILLDKTDPSQIKRVAIDMYRQTKINLPDDVARKKTSEVLTWIKQENGE